ncbi:tetratricopeptide repeat protein [Streptomyces sp. NBRC 110611]|uniref:tetratricopeptide repeat protein n=1 Tax=Streptomyces sp. NBRC 110611 TaxID=1621259 RepID=UPI000832B4F3|nr:tetratricopeptide repeat protein [Streptomyces sp. NBRC 110611]
MPEGEGEAAGPEGDGSGSGIGRIALPVSEGERRAAVAQLWEVAARSPEFAREVLAWAREAQWLAPRAVPAVAHGASRPQMLLPASGTFTDRTTVLDEITRFVDGACRTEGAPAVVFLSGPGGIGKSATATHCAHQLKGRYPDGQLYANLAGASGANALRPTDVLVRFLDRLGVAPERMPADEERQSELYRDCLADRRMLVVLDNASSEAQVEPLLPASSGCLVIVTSRLRLGRLAAERGALARTLPPLSPADSVRLLTRIVGDARVAGREAGALAVAEHCAGIPLALCATGSQLAEREHLTWESMVRRLTGSGSGSGSGLGLGPGPGSESGSGSAVSADRHEGEVGWVREPEERTPRDVVRRAYDIGYQGLRPPAARLYRLAAVWAWPSLSVGMAAKAVGVEEDEARLLLEELARVHLLEEIDEERYRYHDLVREHARQLAAAEDRHTDLANAVRRIVGWLLRRAAAADFRVLPQRWRLGRAYRELNGPTENGPTESGPEDGRAALAELRRERENLAAAVRAADHYGFDELVWQLCEAMWGLHLRLGFHEQWIETHLLGVEAARRQAAEFGDPRAEGRMLVQLAFAYMGARRAEAAGEALGQAVAAEERARHHRGQASAVEALGLLRLKMWDWDGAEPCFEEARRVLGRIGPGEEGAQDVPRALALLEHHIGRAQRGQRRHADAVRRLHGALARFRALDGGDLYNEGRVYMSLGETHLDAGEYELAQVCLDQAIATMRSVGAELQHADAAELRARCAGGLGDPAGATADLRTAAGLYEKAGDYVSLARVRDRLGGSAPEAGTDAGADVGAGDGEGAGEGEGGGEGEGVGEGS